MASRTTSTLVDVPTILDPSSGGKKRRRDDSDVDDGRSVARLMSVALSGPPPAPVIIVSEDDGAAGGAAADTATKDTADKGGEEKAAGDKTNGSDEGKSKDNDVTAEQYRKAELRAQIAAVRAENEAIDARRRDVFGAYANLSSVYNYGLSHIAKLNDLSGAPDNTLP